MRRTEGAVICSRCGKLVSVAEERCPFCGAWRPGLFGFGPAIQRLFGNRFDFISLVVTACVALYVAALLLEPSAIFRVQLPFGILSPGNVALYRLGMTSGAVLRHFGWWWTLFTAIYLHGGLLHIFFNVMWIRNLAPAVDEIYGPARGFVLFTVAGAAGFLLSDFVSVDPTVGASGSIFGLLAALIVHGRRRGFKAHTGQLWQWAIVMFAMGFMIPSVNNYAHAGGFAGGWIAATLMRPTDESREGTGVRLLALALIVVTAAGFVLSFVRVGQLAG